MFANSNTAPVVKLVDTPDLGSGNSGCVGSSPIRRTRKQNPLKISGFCSLIIENLTTSQNAEYSGLAEKYTITLVKHDVMRV